MSLILRSALLSDTVRSNVSVNSLGDRICYLEGGKVYSSIIDGIDSRQETANNTASGKWGTSCGWTQNPYVLWYEAVDEVTGDNTFYSVNVITRHETWLTDFESARNKLVGFAATYPDHVIIYSESDSNLYFVHIETGANQLLLENDLHLTNFIIDTTLSLCIGVNQDGQVLRVKLLPPLGPTVMSTTSTTTTTTKTKNNHGNAVTTVSTRTVRRSVARLAAKTSTFSITPPVFHKRTPRDSALTFIKDDVLESVAVISYNETVKVDELRYINIVTLSERVELNGTTIQGVLRDPVSYNVWAVQVSSRHGGAGEYAFISNTIYDNFDEIKRVIGAGDDVEWTIQSISLDGEVWVVRVRVGGVSEKYFVHYKSSKLLSVLFNAYPALETYELSNTETISFFSRDARKIHAILTLPKQSQRDAVTGFPSRPLPLIVDLVSTNEFGFKEYHQFFANRGYAVVSLKHDKSVKDGHMDVFDAINWSIANGIALQNKISLLGKFESIAPVLRKYVFSFVAVLPVQSAASKVSKLLEEYGSSYLLALGQGVDTEYVSQYVHFPDEFISGFSRIKNKIAFFAFAERLMAKKFGTDCEEIGAAFTESSARLSQNYLDDL
ncbi:hypothetical protein HK100_001518 [Physocladia obscura]|uniref:Uncharacterized protein n=1 Tax=Physocladia obscura TaxID=109957 RepID=A0AAD5T880_9FUNG|nr:hypothetical protein HK100_001518 [Physocladia obscura]